MRGLVTDLLRRWGGEVEVIFPDSTESERAVLEPTASTSWQNMRRTMRDLGEVPAGQFLYIGPVNISGAAFLRRRGRVYLPRRCEEISLGGKVLFYWGLCVPAGEEAAWTDS